MNAVVRLIHILTVLNPIVSEKIYPFFKKASPIWKCCFLGLLRPSSRLLIWLVFITFCIRRRDVTSNYPHSIGMELYRLPQISARCLSVSARLQVHGLNPKMWVRCTAQSPWVNSPLLFSQTWLQAGVIFGSTTSSEYPKYITLCDWQAANDSVSVLIAISDKPSSNLGRSSRYPCLQVYAYFTSSATSARCFSLGGDESK